MSGVHDVCPNATIHQMWRYPDDADSRVVAEEGYEGKTVELVGEKLENRVSEPLRT
jgi:hypothetical protein